MILWSIRMTSMSSFCPTRSGNPIWIRGNIVLLIINKGQILNVCQAQRLNVECFSMFPCKGIPFLFCRGRGFYSTFCPLFSGFWGTQLIQTMRLQNRSRHKTGLSILFLQRKKKELVLEFCIFRLRPFSLHLWFAPFFKKKLGILRFLNWDGKMRKFPTLSCVLVLRASMNII